MAKLQSKMGGMGGGGGGMNPMGGGGVGPMGGGMPNQAGMEDSALLELRGQRRGCTQRAPPPRRGGPSGGPNPAQAAPARPGSA